MSDRLPGSFNCKQAGRRASGRVSGQAGRLAAWQTGCRQDDGLSGGQAGSQAGRRWRQQGNSQNSEFRKAPLQPFHRNRACLHLD